MHIDVATPYRENSIVAIARYAAQSGSLRNFHTTLYTGPAGRWRRFVPFRPFREAIDNELGRRVFSGVPPNTIRTHARLTESFRVTARRLLPGAMKLSAHLMYVAKHRFDKGVANATRNRPPRIVIGMYAATELTFSALEDRSLKVLNFVNSHPRDHNLFLSRAANLPPDHPEMIPDWVAQRVENELALADLVLVPSVFVADQLKAQGVRPEKVSIHPYGVDISHFSPPAERAVGRMVKALFVGQISHRKGVRRLFEVAQRSRHLPVHFDMIGPIVSPEVLTGIPANVTYCGTLPPQAIADAMRSADFFILPSVEDACALVVLEAMATGLPVITTDRNGASEKITDGINGFVVGADDADALYERLEALVSDANDRMRIGEAARASVAAESSWKDYGRDVLALCSSRIL